MKFLNLPKKSFSHISITIFQLSIFILFVLFPIPSTLTPIFAGPTSTNYELKEYTFGAGGTEKSDSTNYSVSGVAGEVDTGKSSSTNYQSLDGLSYTIQSNVPPTPSFTNPSNQYYNKLLLVINTGSNPTDTEYAVAIATDENFSVMQYVQNDNTVGASLGSEDWQTYANWGSGSGENVIGLQSGTNYYVKVMARQGDFTQTGFGPTASAATVDPTISFTIEGVSSGSSVEGVTTDITTTSTQAPFGELPFNQIREAASKLTVSSNAVSGYKVTVTQAGNLQAPSGTVFPPVSGSNGSPSGWPGSVITGAYGYHTSDDSLQNDPTNRFSADNTFAQFSSTASEVAYSSTPVSSEITNVIYAIETGQGQEAGSYSHTITYIATGVF
jgi:hypothetical protein